MKTKEVKTGYFEWDGIEDKQRVSDGDEGKKAWVAGEFKTKFRVIVSVHKPGEKSWPKGGVTIEEVESGRYRYYGFDKVVLHPDNFKKKIYKSKTSIVR